MTDYYTWQFDRSGSADWVSKVSVSMKGRDRLMGSKYYGLISVLCTSFSYCIPCRSELVVGS